MSSRNSLAASVLRCVEQAGDTIAAKDQALVDLALRYAMRIDKGIDEGGQAATKALYLGPHLLNTLRELGLTPNGAQSGGDKPVVIEAVSDELSALRSRHRTGA